MAKRGRKPVTPGERVKPRTLSLADAQWEWLQAQPTTPSAIVRGLIDAAIVGKSVEVRSATPMK